MTEPHVLQQAEVFVLGAGASNQDYKIPLGEELIEKIIDWVEGYKSNTPEKHTLKIIPQTVRSKIYEFADRKIGDGSN